MKVKIIKGTNQIGGCITEISTKNAKIIIDFGDDLDLSGSISIEGLTSGKSCYDAIFITHGHSDHIGHIDEVNKNIPIYVEKKSKLIFDITNDFMSQKSNRVITRDFSFGTPVRIKDIKVTPFKVDHSWCHSAMFLVEADGKKLIHTGDFRLHGRKQEEFLQNLKTMGNIDCLIMEGTCLSRENILNKKESELELEAIEILKNYRQVLILQSSTNIDRLVSFYKASIKTHKKFVEDLFTATIALKLKGKIPNPTFSNVSVWSPKCYQKRPNNFKRRYMIPMSCYKDSKVFHQDFSMLVKCSMLDDIRMLKGKGLLTNACFLYSIWDGYKKQKTMDSFLKEVEKLGIDVYNIHTSGHADSYAMKELYKILKPKKVIPIHTINKGKLSSMMENVYLLEDQEELEI